MSNKLEDAVSVVIGELPLLSMEERLELFDRLTSGYCKSCGTDNPTCQCWNDD